MNDQQRHENWYPEDFEVTYYYSKFKGLENQMANNNLKNYLCLIKIIKVKLK